MDKYNCCPVYKHNNYRNWAAAAGGGGALLACEVHGFMLDYLYFIPLTFIFNKQSQHILSRLSFWISSLYIPKPMHWRSPIPPTHHSMDTASISHERLAIAPTSLTNFKLVAERGAWSHTWTGGDAFKHTSACFQRGHESGKVGIRKLQLTGWGFQSTLPQAPHRLAARCQTRKVCRQRAKHLPGQILQSRMLRRWTVITRSRWQAHTFCPTRTPYLRDP